MCSPILKKNTKISDFWGTWKFCYQQVLKKHMACCLPRTSGKWQENISNFNWREDSDKGSQSSLTGHAAPQGAVNSHKPLIAITGIFSFSFLVEIQRALAVWVMSHIGINNMGNSNTVLRASLVLSTSSCNPCELQGKLEFILQFIRVFSSKDCSRRGVAAKPFFGAAWVSPFPWAPA